MVLGGMGLLDIPRGLISRLPLIGGSSDSSDNPEDEAPKPAAEAPEHDTPDAPDESDTDEVDAVDEPDDEDEPDEGDEPDAVDEPDDDDVEAEDKADDSAEDISDTTAPSIGPNTVIEKDSPEERLAKHEQSDKDAMGLDKRREVIGGNYGASFTKQLLSWIAVVVVAAAAAFGLKLLVDDLDKAPAHPAEKAPWTDSDQKPAPLE
jgi:hypothetical protein